MRFGAIVESHDAPAEADEEVGTKRDESPEGKLFSLGGSASAYVEFAIAKGGGIKGEREGRMAYHRDDFILDDGGQGDQLEVEGEVGLYAHRIVSDIILTLGKQAEESAHGRDVRSSRGARWRWFAVRVSWCRFPAGLELWIERSSVPLRRYRKTKRGC